MKRVKNLLKSIKGWISCPRCGSSNVHNPYDHSYCEDCGATN